MALLGSLFGRSPFRPMQQHMAAVVSCAQQVLPLTEAMLAGDEAAMARHCEEIVRLEHEADTIKNEIRSHLPKRLFMAMERRDLLEILDCQDTIADLAQDIAGLADQRRMTIPDGLVDPVLELVRRTIAAVEHAQGIIEELDELVETGFGKQEVARVEVMLGDLNRLESDTDELAQTALRALFAIEDEIGVGTVFWYQLIGWVADMADYAERVGNRLRLLIAN